MPGSRFARALQIGPAPSQSWYAVATSDGVGGALRSVDALGRALLMFRATDGTAVALDDCCAHRPYPLSLGRLERDVVRCGLCGFEYDATGQCVHVPTQPRIPLGAAVRSYPTREAHGQVWVWFGDPGRAPRHRIPELGWLVDDDWAGVGDELSVAANFLLLHESFADVTKIPVLAPKIAPAALDSTPELDVVVSETTVSLSRSYPATVLPRWQAEAVADGTELATYEQAGHFHSPGVWVDHWDAHTITGRILRMRFAHLVTPIGDGTTRLRWHVSRDFAQSDEHTSAGLRTQFTAYYERLADALGRTHALYVQDRLRPELHVSADAAALRVRDIVRGMLSE